MPCDNCHLNRPLIGTTIALARRCAEATISMRANKYFPSGRGQPLPIILLFSAAALLFVAGVLLWWSTASSENGTNTGPRLAVDREEIDFGRVPLDKTVRAVFTITNDGDSTLTLDASSPVQVLEGC